MLSKMLMALTALAFTTCQLPAQEGEEKITKFAEDVLVHVVLHEMGHGLVREFDLPVLGNEETLADTFATYYVTNFMPDRGLDVVTARVESLLIEAKEVPREEWTVKGEHNSDARRAFQIVAVALAVDAEKYSVLAAKIGMSQREMRNATDYGAEIHRSWRRILKSLMMPPGTKSKEARVGFDPGSKLAAQLKGGKLATELESALQSFDWHSQVTVFFGQGDGGAAWSRSRRTITVQSNYIRRFIKQGAALQDE